MTHEHAWKRLPDLLEDRDEPELLAHVAVCNPCQRQLFLLGRVDRLLREAAPARRKERRRARRVRRLAFPDGVLAAAAAAAVLLVLFLPHGVDARDFTLRATTGEAIGHAVLAPARGERASLELVARGLPTRRAGLYRLWGRSDTGSATPVGRFMVEPNGSCRARFSLPGGRSWARFWVTPLGRPDDVVAST